MEDDKKIEPTKVNATTVLASELRLMLYRCVRLKEGYVSDDNKVILIDRDVRAQQRSGMFTFFYDELADEHKGDVVRADKALVELCKINTLQQIPKTLQVIVIGKIHKRRWW